MTGVQTCALPIFLMEFTRWPEGRLEALEKLEQLRALEHGCPIRVVLTKERTEEVNTPEDLERVRVALAGAGASKAATRGRDR